MRLKPHVNVGVIGQVGHGKSTVTAAILAYLATRGLATAIDYEAIAHAPEEKARGVTISTSRVEYETETRHYTHFDCPSGLDYMKNLVTGVERPDGLILVVSATEGPYPQTREQVLLASKTGVRTIVAFISKIDQVDDPELIDLVEKETRELLSAFGYEGDKVSVIRGDAVAALAKPNDRAAAKCIADLLAAVDKDVATPPRDSDKPLLLTIEAAAPGAENVTTLTGRIERGTLTLGDPIEVVCGAGMVNGIVTGIQIMRRTVERAAAGDRVELKVSGIVPASVSGATLLASPGSTTFRSTFVAVVYWLTKAEGGSDASPVTEARFAQRGVETTGTWRLVVANEPAAPGEYSQVVVELNAPVAVEKGLAFSIRSGGRIAGAGQITGFKE